MKIYFRVDRLRPDQRQYRQTEIELIPEFPLVVSIEIEGKYEETRFAEMEDGIGSDTITLAGLKAIVQACDLVFMGTSVSPQTEFDEDVELDFD